MLCTRRRDLRELKVGIYLRGAESETFLILIPRKVPELASFQGPAEGFEPLRDDYLFVILSSSLHMNS